MAEGLKCQACDNPKAQLERVDSRFMPGAELNLCSTCKNKKHEPRFVLVLAARAYTGKGLNLPDKLKSAIRLHLYSGVEITASDIL